MYIYLAQTYPLLSAYASDASDNNDNNDNGDDNDDDDDDEDLDSEERELIEEENRAIDAAILLSEGEREVIQSRKRARVDELKTDCTCPIVSAEEFKSSVLVGSCSIVTVVLAILDKDLSCATASGSSSNVSAVCTCSAVKKSLRDVTTQLLFLELDALKFYPKHSIHYLLSICRKIQNSYLKNYSEKNVVRLGCVGTSEASDVDTTTYISIITKHVKRLQRILYLEITNGGVPKAFRLTDTDG